MARKTLKQLQEDDEEKKKKELKDAFGNLIKTAGSEILNKKATNATNATDTRQSIDPFQKPTDPFAQPAPLPTTPIPSIRKPAYAGEVVTPEYYSPSAMEKTTRGTYVTPPPEQVRGTSPELEIGKEQEQLLATQTPTRQELDPERIAAEKLPFFGGFVSAGKTLGSWVKNKLGFKTIDEARFDPANFRTAELAAIAKEEAERGLTFNEVLGAYVEALPTGDSLLGVSFAKTLEQPSDNANQVATNIRKIKRQISNIETNVRMGYLPVPTAQTQINDMEANVIRLESRLKTLVNNSPSLKFNSDLVNTFETDILTIKEKILQAQLNILQGKINDPDEMQMFLKTQAIEAEGLADFEAGSLE